MRIVMVNKYAHVTGGADWHCLTLARALRARGHQVVFLSTASDLNVEHEGFFVPLTVTSESRDRLSAPGSARVAVTTMWNTVAGRAMQRILDTFMPDVVHAHKLYPQLSVAPVVAAERARVPIIQTLHDYELLSASWRDHRGRWIDRDETRLSYRFLNTITFPLRRFGHGSRIAHWLAHSRYVAHVYARCGIYPDVLRSFVLPPAYSELPSYEERRGVAFVGRLSPEKGIDDVIDLARRLPHLPVAIAGGGPLTAKVEAAAQRIPNLTFEGSLEREAVFRLLASVRVSVVPSVWEEPAGLAAVEAMWVGTPVVAYASGGLAEYVTDAGGGQVVPKVAGALIGAVRLLHDDHERWRRIAAAGAATVPRTHSIDDYVDRLEVVYAEAAREAAAR